MVLQCRWSCRSRRSRVFRLDPPPTAAEGECNRACSDCRAATAVAELIPQAPALAGASVGTRKVLRLWITVSINLYIISLTIIYFMYQRFHTQIQLRPSVLAACGFVFFAHPQLRPKASAVELARIAEPFRQKRNLFRPRLGGIPYCKHTTKFLERQNNLLKN